MVGKQESRKRLVHAILAGSPEEVEALLDEYPEAVDAPDSHRNTPIGAAIKRGRLELVQRLVERGADPLQRNHGGTGLIDVALQRPSVAIVDFLVSSGCPLEPHHAAQLGDLQTLEGLVERDEGVLGLLDRRGGSLLHAAARGNQLETCEWLVARGADVSRPNKHRVPPLGDAVEFGAQAVVEFLLDQQADPDSRAGHFQGTVLHRAIFHRSTPLVRLLLERGADPDRQDGAGKTALHISVGVGVLEIVELVLAHGPDLDLRSVIGIANPVSETALEYARRRGRVAIAARIEATMSSG